MIKHALCISVLRHEYAAQGQDLGKSLSPSRMHGERQLSRSGRPLAHEGEDERHTHGCWLAFVDGVVLFKLDIFPARNMFVSWWER